MLPLNGDLHHRINMMDRICFRLAFLKCYYYPCITDRKDKRSAAVQRESIGRRHLVVGHYMVQVGTENWFRLFLS